MSVARDGTVTGMRDNTQTQVVTSAPCSKCPFRVQFKGEDDYLRPGRRAGIARGLLEDQVFPCHNTVDHDEMECDGETDACVTGGVQCAGAALMMLRAGYPTQMMRIEERLGMVDWDAFEERHASIELWTLDECLHELDDDDDETMGCCSVVGPGCEAPAGWMVGGAVVPGDTQIDTTCPACGEFVCETCSDDEGRCLDSWCSDVVG